LIYMKAKIRQHWPSTKGFTLLELSISLVILAMIALFSGRLYINYTNSSRDFKAANLVYEETRFLMERIIREVRTGAIDYEEYFNQNVMIPYVADTAGDDGSYGDNYCSYSNFFYDNNGESIGSRNLTLKAAYLLSVPSIEAINSVENELYLINVGGDEKTIVKRVEKDVSGNGELTGKVVMLNMIGQDFGDDGIDGNDSYNGLGGSLPACEPDNREHDGKIDSWHCDPDFPCIFDYEVESDTLSNCYGYKHVIVTDPADPDHSFLDISPNALDIVDLKFMIAPADDPWKAYNINDVQMQPHITIQLTAKAHPYLVDTRDFKQRPSITLTSTVTMRNYDEINSDCR